MVFTFQQEQMSLSPITTSLLSSSSSLTSSSNQQPLKMSPWPSNPTTMPGASPPLPSPSSSSSQTPSSSTSIVPSIMAGYVSGICAVVVGHPMDSAKVWMQTNTNMQHIMTMTSSSPSSSSKKNSSSPRVAAGTSSSSTTTAATRGANMSTLASTMNTAAAANELPPLPTWRRNMIYSWRMIRALYAGVTGPLMTVGAIQSLNFAVYETTRRELHYYQHVLMLNSTTSQQQQQTTLPLFDRDTDSLWNVAIAGGTSGVVLSFVTVPFLMIKTTSQVRGIGFRSALQEVLRVGRLPSATNGGKSSSLFFIPPFYRIGFGIHSLIEITSRTVYYATYEGCKRSLRRYREERRVVTTPVSWTTTATTTYSSNTLAERMISAALAGIGCWAIIFPLDSIRSRMLAQMAAAGQVGGHPTTTTATQHQVMVAWDMAKHMYQQGIMNSGSDASAQQRLRRGLQPFFRGFGVTVLRAGPVAAAALPVYDMVLEHVSRNYYD